MLLHDARRRTRVDDDGDLVLLADQDRSRWNHDEISEGVGLLEQALRRSAVGGGPGPYQLQAAIAALHDEAATDAGTDWVQIEVLYRHLARVAPSPVVELNWAVAVAMAYGPEHGLARIDAIVARGELGTNHLLFAARADLLVRLGRRDEARICYLQAAAAASTAAERRFLHRRLDELGPPAG
jgi:RNA polymerase sigma-70 factor (ECF subfamily)